MQEKLKPYGNAYGCALKRMKKNKTKIRNIRACTLSASCNSYSTIDPYQGALVNYDRAER